MLLALFVLSACANEVSDDTGAVAGDTVTDRSLLTVQERGKLIVGSDIPYPPMEMFDEAGNPIGLDIDVAKAVAAKMNVEVEFVDYGWDELFVAVKDGSVDFGVSSITITVDRSKEMLFSSPYFDAGQTIVVPANAQFKEAAELKGKKIGAMKETTSFDEAVKLSGDAALATAYENMETTDGAGIVPDLKSGKIDALIVDYVGAADIVKKDPSLKILGTPVTQEYYGFATKLGNDALANEVNKHLREMTRNGELKAIQDKWLK
jgi:polar amino acid transport system substrate-binding protein